MTVLRGRAHLKIDPKGRISLPAQFRSQLSSIKQLFITNSLHQGRRFLDCYTRAEWESLEKKIEHMPSLKGDVQAFKRFYLSSVEVCDVDGQGRVLVPQHLREYADLKDDIVLVGMGKKLELWSSTIWTEQFNDLTKNFDQVLEVLADLQNANPKAGRKK